MFIASMILLGLGSIATTIGGILLIDDYRAGRRAVSKLSTDLESISQALEVYEEGGDNWTPSFTYGYLDGISLKLQHLIDEVEAEKIDIPVTTKEEETNDGREQEGLERDDSGEEDETNDGRAGDGEEFDWRYDKSTDSFVRTEGNTGHDGCSTDPGSEKAVVSGYRADNGEAGRAEGDSTGSYEQDKGGPVVC